MVNASKILTVSYGTFSCTLEGFDDTFSTMKDISEYFRDLASEDRFFGAEPPKLDADMLRHIAELNTKTSVSAQVGDNSVTLRPTSMQVSDPAAFVASSMVNKAVDAVIDQPEVEDEVAPIVEKDAAIEEAAPEDHDDMIDIIAEAEIADQDEPEAVWAAEDTAEDVTVEEDAITPSPAPAVETTPLTMGEDTTVAERLARIRALVAEEAESYEAESFEEIYSEDQHAEHITQSAEDTIATLLADDDIIPTTDEPVEDNIADDIFEQTMSDTAPSDPEVEVEPEIEEDTSSAETHTEVEVEPEIAATPIPTPIVRAIVTRVRRSASEIMGFTPKEQEAPVTMMPLSAHDEADLQAEFAQIEAETAPHRAATQAKDPADLERLFDATQSRFDGVETSRAHANISHLKAAVAARNADASAPDAEPQGDETEAYREDLANAVKPLTPRSTEAQHPAPEPISPLMLVSEQRVDDGLEYDEDEDDEDGLIENLALPTAEEEDDQPSYHTPRDMAPYAGKVLPRRVRRAMTDSFETDGDTLASVAAAALDNMPTTRGQTSSDFEDFAAELGAKELIDILEAAAAYSQMVQGSESFSRPKLLHLAMEADETFSREEGLRSFGQLLRNGTIKKIKRGSFELTRTSRYAEPASKRAAS